MQKQLKGTIALIFLTMLYGMYGVFNRLMGDAFNAFSQQLFRNGFTAIIILLLLVLFNKQIKFKKIQVQDIKWIILWALSGLWIGAGLFAAFANLSLSTVYFLFYSTMIISGVLCGRIFFGEKFDWVEILSICFSLIGLYFIYSLTINPKDYLFVLLSLAIGIALGFWNTISKKFSKNYPELQIVFWDALVSAVAGLVGIVFLKESLPVFAFSPNWFWLIVYGITQIFSVVLLIYGFKKLEAQTASLIMPIEIIFAAIFGYLIFGETLTVGSMIGGGFIAVGALLPNLKGFIKKR